MRKNVLRCDAHDRGNSRLAAGGCEDFRPSFSILRAQGSLCDCDDACTRDCLPLGEMKTRRPETATAPDVPTGPNNRCDDPRRFLLMSRSGSGESRGERASGKPSRWRRDGS
jgi:hypothetical protein